MGSKKAWTGYIVYALVFAVAMLWLRFPSGLLVRFLEARAAQASPEMELIIDHARLSPVMALAIGRVEVFRRGAPGAALFSVQDLTLRPGIRPLLDGRFGCSFSGLAYGGELEGSASVTRGSDQGDVHLNMRLSDVRAGALEVVQLALGREITGRLSGEMTYDGKRGGGLMQGLAEGSLRLTEGRLAYLDLPPLLRLEPVQFEEVTLSFSLESGVLVVEQAEWRGPQFNGTFSGGITLQPQLGRSRLELKGTIRPSSEFLKGGVEDSEAMAYIKEQMRKQRKGSVSLAVSGTLADPVVKLL